MEGWSAGGLWSKKKKKKKGLSEEKLHTLTGAFPSPEQMWNNRAEGRTDADSGIGPVGDFNLGSGPRRRQTAGLRPPELSAASYLPDRNNE